MVKSTIIALALLLSACAHTETKPEQPIVTKVVYVIVKLPDSITAIPENVPPIDLNTATQREVGIWLAKNEFRIASLEFKVLANRHALAALIKKENLKEGDYKIVELTEKELLDAQNSTVKP